MASGLQDLARLAMADLAATLAFVAEHILTALERRQGRDSLEQRVRERTAELARANQDMRKEVTERQRGERLQAALYRIAELASSETALSSDQEQQREEAIAADAGDLCVKRHAWFSRCQSCSAPG